MNRRVFSIPLVAGFLAAAQSTPPPVSQPSRQEDALRLIEQGDGSGLPPRHGEQSRQSACRNRDIGVVGPQAVLEDGQSQSKRLLRAGQVSLHPEQNCETMLDRS